MPRADTEEMDKAGECQTAEWLHGVESLPETDFFGLHTAVSELLWESTEHRSVLPVLRSHRAREELKNIVSSARGRKEPAGQHAQAGQFPRNTKISPKNNQR